MYRCCLYRVCQLQRTDSGDEHYENGDNSGQSQKGSSVSTETEASAPPRVDEDEDSQKTMYVLGLGITQLLLETYVTDDFGQI